MECPVRRRYFEEESVKGTPQFCQLLTVKFSVQLPYSCSRFECRTRVVSDTGSIGHGYLNGK